MCKLRSVIFISMKSIEVPVWEKTNLTVEETAAYSGIGINRIKELSNEDDCPFVLWVGSKRLIKRKKFDDYIDRQYSI
ncbi:helix-turn-helix domain-containing protein [Roseburia hominis]|nr:helix-turn-helix domain-containing protein [Roseburia hominis]